MKCPQCDFDVQSGQKVCEICGIDLPDPAPVSSRKLSLPLLIAIALLCVAVGGVFLLRQNHIKQQEAAFTKQLDGISGEMVVMLGLSVNVIKAIEKEWRLCIKSPNPDINRMIRTTLVEHRDKVFKIEDLSKKIAKDLRGMSAPESQKERLKRMKELYILFDEYAQFAISPSGSFISYSRAVRELSTKTSAGVKELQIM